MKIMVYLILNILIFVSCDNQQLVQNQNDIWWIEIIDTLKPNIGCNERIGIVSNIPDGLEYDSLITINNDTDYQNLLKKLETIGCKNQNQVIVNFDERTLLGYSLLTGRNVTELTFFKNEKLREYNLVVDVKLLDSTFLPVSVWKWLIVRKLDSNYKINVLKQEHY